MVLYYHTPAGQRHVKPRINPGTPARANGDANTATSSTNAMAYAPGTKLPPSYSMASGLGGGGPDTLPPRPPARRSFSAPGLAAPQSLLGGEGAFGGGEGGAGGDAQPLHFGGGPPMTRLPRHATGVGVPVDNDQVPSAAIISAASRRPGRPLSPTPSAPGSLAAVSSTAAATMSKALRQSESAARLATPPPRDPTRADQWSYYNPETFPSFSRDVSQLPQAYSQAFASKQHRHLNETKGTYLRHDPRALAADGIYDGWHLDHQYVGTDLVTAYPRTGIVPNNGPRLRPTPKSEAPLEMPLSKPPPLGRRPPPQGTWTAKNKPGKGSSEFVTRQPRFLPYRTWAGNDPRALGADDPFDGVHDHQYQAHSNYFAKHDPTALTKGEEEVMREAARKQTEQAEHDAIVQRTTSIPLNEAKQPTPAQISNERDKAAHTKQALLASAVSAGLADPRSIGKYDPPMPSPSRPARDNFHDTNDHFRYGVVIKQPKGRVPTQAIMRAARACARRRACARQRMRAAAATTRRLPASCRRTALAWIVRSCVRALFSARPPALLPS